MADALVLEFEGMGVEAYERVNGHLGIDMHTGEGDWPQGLLFHSAGTKPGGFFVYEVWSSQAEQEAFLEGRLGEALEKGGAGQPARMEWLGLASAHDLGL